MISVDREEMIERFANFLREYTDEDGNPVYRGKITDLLTITPKRSVAIDWMHLNSFDSELAHEVIENPEEGISAAEDAIQIVLREDFQREDVGKIHARFYNLPETLMVKDIGAEHINKLIQVEGIVTRVGEIKPFVSVAVFVCKDCGHEMIVPQKPYESLEKVKKCEQCGSKNIELDVNKSSFVNFQSFRIQDRPETLKGGEMPRFIDGILLDDIVDVALPGDRVIVTGILRVVLEKREKTPIFRKILEVNHIEPVSKEIQELEISPEEEQIIKELAKRKDIVDAIVDSIAPAIYGYKEVKKGIALALFGGVSRKLPDGTRLRGDIHVLLVGDPGVAKSQILRYVANLAPRAIYTSGKSSSAAGLCVAPDSLVVVNDKVQEIGKLTEEWGREVGFLEYSSGIFYAPYLGRGISLDLVTGKVKPSVVSKVWKLKSPEELVTIKTITGKEITVTPETKLLTFNGTLEWKEAGKIKPGDYVLTVKKLHINGKQETLDEKLAYKRGLSLSDPLEFFSSSERTISAYLKGIFDKVGRLVGDTAVIKVDKDMAKRLQILLLRLGIVSSVDETGKVIIGREYIQKILGYNVSVVTHEVELFREFIAEISKFYGTSEEDVYSSLHEKGELDIGTVPVELPEGLREEINRERATYSELVKIAQEIKDEKLYNKLAWILSEVTEEEAKIKEKVNTLKVILSSDLIPERVESVKIIKSPYPYVYDLTVEGSHSFIANGFVVHNTAAAVRDEFTGGWVLEAGALVLADGGYALIDELDKMSDRDRSVIHEALEQQTISISKAGITATLNARTTVIAAANPKQGRFNRMKNPFEQIDLPPTLLSRFDLIFVLIDEPDDKIDSEVARHILRVRRGESEVVAPKIPHEILRKYIAYARKNIHPVISEEAMEEIEKYYVRMRKSVKKTKGEEEGIPPIPITARQLEALIRLSEAHARMRLSPIVTREDAREAIKLMEYTLKQIAMDETGQIDVTILELGQSARKLSKIEKILDIIEKLQKTSERGAHVNDILEEAKKAGIEKQEAREILEKLLEKGQIYMPESGYYKTV